MAIACSRITDNDNGFKANGKFGNKNSEKLFLRVYKNVGYFLKFIFFYRGVLINRYTVLTAGHCIMPIDTINYKIPINDSKLANYYSVYAGVHDISFLNKSISSGRTKRMLVKEIILVNLIINFIKIF
jgi:hypothetical protein